MTVIFPWFILWFVWFDSLRPSQQFFSYVGTGVFLSWTCTNHGLFCDMWLCYFHGLFSYSFDLILYIQSTIFSYVGKGHPWLNLYLPWFVLWYVTVLFPWFILLFVWFDSLHPVNNFQLSREGSSLVETVLAMVCSVMCDMIFPLFGLWFVIVTFLIVQKGLHVTDVAEWKQLWLICKYSGRVEQYWMETEITDYSLI